MGTLLCTHTIHYACTIIVNKVNVYTHTNILTCAFVCAYLCVCLMTNVMLLLVETGKEAEEGEAHWSCDYSRDLVPS